MRRPLEWVPEEAAVAAWLVAVANRDSEALAMLYGHTRPRLMAVLVRLLQRRELAEEVLQDVYLRVWNRAGDYQPQKGSAIGWLLAIARNAALDCRRRHWREVLEADRRKVPDVHATEDSATLADISAIRRGLCACVDELGDEQRRCLLLVYLEGLPYDELAERVGRPVGTVKSWVHRSLIQLRRCLDPA